MKNHNNILKRRLLYILVLYILIDRKSHLYLKQHLILGLYIVVLNKSLQLNRCFAALFSLQVNVFV